MNNIYKKFFYSGFELIKSFLTVFLIAGAFLSFAAAESSAQTKVIPVNAVLDFSSGGTKSAMVSTDNLQIILECDNEEVNVTFLSLNGNSAANFNGPITITPEMLIGMTSNQVDILSAFLDLPNEELGAAVIIDSTNPGQAQMATFGPGVLSNDSGEAIIISTAQVTYNLFGSDTCSYTGNVSIVDP